MCRVDNHIHNSKFIGFYIFSASVCLLCESTLAALFVRVHLCEKNLMQQDRCDVTQQFVLMLLIRHNVPHKNH